MAPDVRSAQRKLLYPLGHHAITCTHGVGDVVTHHNMLRVVVAKLFRQVHMGVTVEVGHGLTSVGSLSCPTDVLVARWVRGLPAALDITVTSPLTPAILVETCSIAGVAAANAESPANMTPMTHSVSSWGGSAFHLP